MSAIGLPMAAHVEPHLSGGLCVCPCDECTTRTAKFCVCLDCSCESQEDHHQGCRGERIEWIAVPFTPEPIPDFPGFIASMLGNGSTLNPCRDHCQDRASEHVHLHTPSGNDGIIWADGRVSEWDLTQPARLIYPAAGHAVHFPSLPKDCYRMPGGSMVHVKPGCRCRAKVNVPEALL